MANTKRALLGSALAIVACVAMLIGSTFAWFTDTAGTAVNKIQAGRLDVVLEMKVPTAATDTSDAGEEWVSAEGKVLAFKKAAGHENEPVLWEPGCRYELPQLRIRNNGNLALKYRVIINGIKGDAKLNKAIDWTIGDVAMGEEQHLKAGEAHEFTIKGVMRTDAGNEYQGLSIEGISIKVYATQDTVESDSFGNTYDENAQYVPSIVDGDDAAEKELTKNEENINVILSRDVTFDVKPYDQKPMGGDKTKSIVIDGNGHKLIFNNTNSDWNNVTWGDAKLTIKNAVIDNSGYFDDYGAWNSHDIYFNGDLVLENVTFTNAVALEGTATLKNVTISDKNVTQDTYMLWICAGSTVTAENLTIDGKSAVGKANRAIAIKDEYVTDPQQTTLTINNATITSDKYAAVYVTSASATTVDLNGTIDVTGTAVNDVVAQKSSDSTGALTVNDNSTKVAAPGTQNELNDAIANATGPVAVRLPEGEYTLPDDLSGKNITVVGKKDTVVNMAEKVNAHADNIAFEGVTVAFGSSDYKGFQHTGKLTYKDCVITGKQFLYAGEVEFINCKFVQDVVDYNVWTYGAGKVLFKDCTFECVGKAVLIYNEGSLTSQTVEFQNCAFNASAPATGKAAIEIDARFTSYDVVIDKATADSVSGFANGSKSGSTVWNVKNEGKTTTVTVDGVTVYAK